MISLKSALSSTALCAAAALVSIAAGAADPYPAKPIELVVAFQAGGGTDAMARAFAEAAGPHLSQPIIVTNKAGASGSIGLSYGQRRARWL